MKTKLTLIVLFVPSLILSVVEDTIHSVKHNTKQHCEDFQYYWNK